MVYIRKKVRERDLYGLYISNKAGNMLTAPDFAIIGKDALVATCYENGLNEDEAKALIATEYGYKKQDLYFVEQPDYHIDLMITLLGGKRVLVKKQSNGVPLDKTTIKDLKKYLGTENVIIDDEEIAGKQNGNKWEYIFFNGEFIEKDGELYYITNGTDNKDAQEKFGKYLKEQVNGLKDVIFSSEMNSAKLNESQGGVGCRYKGNPVTIISDSE